MDHLQYGNQPDTASTNEPQSPSPVGMLIAELRKLPRYWVSVAERPMGRSVQSVLWCDVERAIEIAARKAKT